jgi:hypothetical protein
MGPWPQPKNQKSILISLTASSISEIYYRKPKLKKCSINWLKVSRGSIGSFAGRSHFMGDNDS